MRALSPTSLITEGKGSVGAFIWGLVERRDPYKVL